LSSLPLGICNVFIFTFLFLFRLYKKSIPITNTESKENPTAKPITTDLFLDGVEGGAGAGAGG
jgi:hypothetical protein